MKKLMNKGFTLVELMVVIVIVGILAAVAIPKFTVASHKAKASEFPTVLSSIYQAEHTYQAETGTFTSTLSETGVDAIESKWFSYDVGLGTSNTAFTASAGVKVTFGEAAAGTKGWITDAGVKTADAALAKYVPNWANK